MVPLLEELGVMLHRNHGEDPLDALLPSIHKETLLPHLRALTVVSLPSSEVHACFMTVVRNRGLKPNHDGPFNHNSPRLRHMRLYQHDPNWDFDLETEQEWQEVGSDYFDIRFARVEREFKANFLTSLEW